MSQAPILLWFRRDLRLADHPALYEAAKSGRAIIPVFLLDEVLEAQGAAPKFRIGLSVEALAKSLENIGSKLILRRGTALNVLRQLVEETGASSVWWSRLYDPTSRTRDEAVKAGLKEDGLDARSFPGHVLFEPWSVETGQGGFYRVYTPFWKAVRARNVGAALPVPSKIEAPDSWPGSDALEKWHLGAEMRRGVEIVAPYQAVGEDAARTRLDSFIEEKIGQYKETRDFPAVDGTSRLSENLTYGEISPRLCWLAGQRARDVGQQGAEKFLMEIAWREFAYHLVYHTPHIVSESWRSEWQNFPWKNAMPEAWHKARTGIPIVDAGLREMFVTGTMHNRVRMIVASYLTKHLMTDWRVGARWFEDCLADWDPASNALGWQWVAGAGPDASPYFRIFNPVTQAKKFDPKGEYRDMWLAEGKSKPMQTALSYFEAIPKSWRMGPDDPYPNAPPLAEGRERALAAYQAWKS